MSKPTVAPVLSQCQASVRANEHLQTYNVPHISFGIHYKTCLTFFDSTALGIQILMAGLIYELKWKIRLSDSSILMVKCQTK